MPPSASLPWNVLASIVSAGAVIIGGLVALYLRSIKQDLHALSERNDKQDDLIAGNQQGMTALGQQLATCKIDCQAVTVSKEDYIRSEGRMRRQLEQLTAAINRLEGQLQVMQQLPEVCGKIVGKVVEQLKHGE